MMSRMKEGGVVVGGGVLEVLVEGFEGLFEGCVVGESSPSSSSERSRMKRSARDMVGVSVCVCVRG